MCCSRRRSSKVRCKDWSQTSANREMGCDFLGERCVEDCEAAGPELWQQEWVTRVWRGRPESRGVSGPGRAGRRLFPDTHCPPAR